METKKYWFLDALRGIAIIMVLLVHVSYAGIPMNTYLTHIGVFGVSLFFMISSYTLSLSQYKKEYNLRTIKEFFIKRFFRIYPLYVLTISIIFAFKIMGHRLGYDYMTAAWASLDLFNVFSHYTFLFGFFPNTLNAVWVWEWSLFVEFCFYIVFLPILYYLSKSLPKILWFIIWTTCVSILWWQIYFFIWNQSLEHFFFFSPLNHLVDFSVWFLLFYIHRQYDTHQKKILSYKMHLFVLIITIIWCVMLYMLGIHTHIIWLIPFFFLSIWMLYGSWVFRLFAESPFLIYLWKVSYSVYLNNIFIFLILGKLPFHWFIKLWIWLILIYWISYFTYKIELRGINIWKKKASYLS